MVHLRPPIPIPRRRERDDERTYSLLPVRKAPRLDGQLELFKTARRSLALARGNTWVAHWLRFGRRGARWQDDPERAPRRAVFRLASRAMPTRMLEQSAFGQGPPRSGRRHLNLFRRSRARPLRST